MHKNCSNGMSICPGCGEAKLIYSVAYQILKGPGHSQATCYACGTVVTVAPEPKCIGKTATVPGKKVVRLPERRVTLAIPKEPSFPTPIVLVFVSFLKKLTPNIKRLTPNLKKLPFAERNKKTDNIAPAIGPISKQDQPHRVTGLKFGGDSLSPPRQKARS